MEEENVEKRRRKDGGRRGKNKFRICGFVRKGGIEEGIWCKGCMVWIVNERKEG